MQIRNTIQERDQSAKPYPINGQNSWEKTHDNLWGLKYNLYNNQINARALIAQSAMVYCAGKPMEKSRAFLIII